MTDKQQNTRSRIQEAQEAEHKKQNIHMSNIMIKMTRFCDYKQHETEYINMTAA